MKIIHDTKLRRKVRTRAKISGSGECPRISVHRTNQHLYAQAIDDTTHNTVAMVSTIAKDIRDTLPKDKKRMEISFVLGQQLAEKLKEKKISRGVFDRGAARYKGNVKAFADGLRDKGLEI